MGICDSLFPYLFYVFLFINDMITVLHGKLFDIAIARKIGSCRLNTLANLWSLYWYYGVCVPLSIGGRVMSSALPESQKVFHLA